MVAKWIAWAIIAGFIGIAIPIVWLWIWSISSAFLSAVLLFALIIGIVSLVIGAIDEEIKNKRLKENGEDESND